MRLIRWIPLTLTLFLVGCNSPAQQAAAPTSTPNPTAPGSPEAAAPQAPKPDAAQPKSAAPQASKPEAATPAPSAAGSKAPAAIPAGGTDPIVGKWEMKNEQVSVVFQMSPNGKVALDTEATRKGLRAALEQQIQKDPNLKPEQKQQALSQMAQSLDQQLAQYEGTWAKVGKLYKITNKTPGQKEVQPSWARVEGNQLIPTDDKGASKKGDPIATRVG